MNLFSSTHLDPAARSARGGCPAHPHIDPMSLAKPCGRGCFVTRATPGEKGAPGAARGAELSHGSVAAESCVSWHDFILKRLEEGPGRVRPRVSFSLFLRGKTFSFPRAAPVSRPPAAAPGTPQSVAALSQKGAGGGEQAFCRAEQVVLAILCFPTEPASPGSPSSMTLDPTACLRAPP
jgi:hypothetical protein